MHRVRHLLRSKQRQRLLRHQSAKTEKENYHKYESSHIFQRKITPQNEIMPSLLSPNSKSTLTQHVKELKRKVVLIPKCPPKKTRRSHTYTSTHFLLLLSSCKDTNNPCTTFLNFRQLSHIYQYLLQPFVTHRHSKKRLAARLRPEQPKNNLTIANGKARLLIMDKPDGLTGATKDWEENDYR